MRRSTNTPHLGPYRFLRQYFNLHIPIHELPDRIDEVARDKFEITFCISDAFRISGGNGLCLSANPGVL